jgi:esterase/lipase superfamily enzyme
MPYKITEELLHDLWGMPSLSHYPDRRVKFNFADSHVIQFIMKTLGVDLPDAKRAFEFIRRSGDIMFHPVTKTWMGKTTFAEYVSDRNSSEESE